MDNSEPKIYSLLESTLVDRLTDLYLKAPAAVAKCCDEALDKSGSLLGEVRKQARIKEVGREKGAPNEASFWYMHDNHTFSPLIGDTLDEIIQSCEKVRTPYGMLCPVILKCMGKEVRRIGPPAYCRDLADTEFWKESLAVWKRAVQEDSDVMRILHFEGNKIGPGLL